MQRIRAAIANNVEWCGLVCRAHGVPATTRQGLWLTGDRPPMLYPDVITIEPGTTAATVAKMLEGRTECAVKDSWKDVDLSGEGFFGLFDARWISREPVRGYAVRLQWSVLDRPRQIDQWEAAAGLHGLLTPELLAEPQVRTLLARREGAIVGGAIVSRSSSVAGVSNVFSTTADDSAAVWRDIPAALANLCPGLPLVGYEQGGDLDHALAAGFSDIGPLRVWLRG